MPQFFLVQSEQFHVIEAESERAALDFLQNHESGDENFWRGSSMVRGWTTQPDWMAALKRFKELFKEMEF